MTHFDPQPAGALKAAAVTGSRGRARTGIPIRS